MNVNGDARRSQARLMILKKRLEFKKFEVKPADQVVDMRRGSSIRGPKAGGGRAGG